MWQPKTAIADEKKLLGNLLGFFRTNQKDALAWANGGVALKEFVELHNSATGRVDTVFPVLMIAATRLKTDFDDGDILEAAWQIEIELAVADSKADLATEKTHKYAAAVESMLANILSRDLCAGFSQLQKSYLETIVSEFDVLRKRSANEFLQIAVLSAEFSLKTSAY